MLLDQISLLTAIAFSCAALMITMLVSWLGSRANGHLLSWAAGLALTTVGVVAFSTLDDHYDPVMQFAAFALLLSGFALIYGGARQFRHGTMSMPIVFAIWASLIGLTIIAFAAGLSGVATIITNLGSALLLVLAAYEYWAGRDEAPLPLVAVATLYAATAVSFALCAAVLLFDRQFVLEARPSNWAEDLNSIMVIVALTGIGALSVTLSQARTAHRHRREALTDQLTGLLNRRALFDAFSGRKIDSGVAVMLFDLDHFKLINDRLGHAGGDQVLQRFAQIVRANVRTTDTAARLGGEEFCIVLQNLPSRSAGSVAERIRAALEQSATPSGQRTVTITVSAGVATSGGEGELFENLLARADEALYKAKSAGRNRVHSADLRLVA